MNTSNKIAEKSECPFHDHPLSELKPSQPFQQSEGF